MKSQLLLAALLLLFLSSCTTNFYIVRHAEKANATPDTALSAAGFQRAQDLADYLSDKGIDNVYTSQYLRTQQTAQPTADAAGKVPVVYEIHAQFDDMITQLKSHKDNRSILVVNHSNTVPDIIDALMESPQGIVIPENDFDNIYHVKIKRATNSVRIFTPLTYGQSSP